MYSSGDLERFRLGLRSREELDRLRAFLGFLSADDDSDGALRAGLTGGAGISVRGSFRCDGERNGVGGSSAPISNRIL